MRSGIGEDGTFMRGVEYYLNAVKTAMGSTKDSLNEVIDELDVTNPRERRFRDLIQGAINELENAHE